MFSLWLVGVLLLFSSCNAIDCSTNAQLWLLSCTDVFQFQGYGISTLAVQAKRCSSQGQKLTPGQCTDPLRIVINASVVAPVPTPPFSQSFDLSTNMPQIPVLAPFVYLTFNNLVISPTSAQFTISIQVCAISCGILSKTQDIYTVKFGDPTINPCSLPSDVQCPADNCHAIDLGSNMLASSTNGSGVSAGIFYAVVVLLLLVMIIEAILMFFIYMKWKALLGSADYSLLVTI